MHYNQTCLPTGIGPHSVVQPQARELSHPRRNICKVRTSLTFPLRLIGEWCWFSAPQFMTWWDDLQKRSRPSPRFSSLRRCGELFFTDPNLAPDKVSTMIRRPALVPPSTTVWHFVPFLSHFTVVPTSPMLTPHNQRSLAWPDGAC